MATSDSVAITQIKNYLHYCEYNREYTTDTIDTKRYHLNRFLREHTTQDFREVTNQLIDQWRAKMFEAGLSKKTINNHVDDVVGCIKYLRKRQQERVALDLDAVERYRIRYSNEDLPSFSPQEIVYIKQQCKTLMEKLAFSMAFETAMRLHEVTYLRVEDIRWQDNGKRYFRIEGKGRTRRNTFLLPDTEPLFDRWLILSGIEEGYVFPSPVRDGLPYTNDQMRKIITRPIRRAGFDIGGPHAIRRSSITITLDNGMPLPKAAKWAGHSDPKITLRHYYKPNIKDLQEEHEEAMQKAFAFANIQSQKPLTNETKMPYDEQ